MTETTTQKKSYGQLLAENARLVEELVSAEDGRVAERAETARLTNEVARLQTSVKHMKEARDGADRIRVEEHAKAHKDYQEKLRAIRGRIAEATAILTKV